MATTNQWVRSEYRQPGHLAVFQQESNERRARWAWDQEPDSTDDRASPRNRATAQGARAQLCRDEGWI